MSEFVGINVQSYFGIGNTYIQINFAGCDTTDH